MENTYDVIIDNGNINDTNNATGWKCPKCGSSINPKYIVCPICGGKRTNESLAPGETMILS